MHSWSRPFVPRLSDLDLGTAPPLKLYDTASETLKTVDPDDTARLYVCGITPYDATHLGHANTYLTFDLINRYWRDRGLNVTYTQNVTDVDDPLLERATATGQDWVELAQREIQLFRDDMTAMRVLPPEHYIGAVESIDLVIDLIERLENTGAVYGVDDDLYFSVHCDANFGAVSGWDRELMMKIFAERGGDPEREGKRDPLDCLLWLAERPGEPSWPSPWGQGRPGWHIECAAIALHHLGTAFDIQGGGSDLIFPHHEMSASEVHVVTSEPFAQNYVHAGMVAYEGEKMSKSKGNLVLVSATRASGADPMALRLALLAEHHRADWEWFDHRLTDAATRLASWRAAFARDSAAPAAETVAALRDALSQDLDTPQALRIIDTWAHTDGSDSDAPAVVAAAVDALLGII